MKIVSWLTAGAALAASAATAAVRTENLLEPADVLRSAYLWLDASRADTFTTNETGGVTAWRGLGDSGRNAQPATAYLVGGTTVTRYGTVGVTNGVPAYLMGETGSGIDMSFPVSTNLLTTFWAMDIADDGNAFFLGDSEKYQFHRGGNGEYCRDASPSAADKGWANGDVWCDGAKVAQQTDHPPRGLHVYTGRLALPCTARRFSQDRWEKAVARNGGRALSEMLLFNRTLTDFERRWVECWLRVKWMDGTDVLDGLVNSSAAVFPNLRVDEGGRVVVPRDPSPIDGSQPFVLVAGTLRKGSAARFSLKLPEDLFCLSRRTLLRCGAADGFTGTGDFDVEGLPAGLTLAWNGTALEAVAAAPVGSETKTLTAGETLQGPAAFDGLLARGAAEKVRIEMPRTLAAWAGRSCTILSCACSDGIHLSDFEVVNLPAGAKLSWNGRTLTAEYTASLAPGFLRDGHLWLDVGAADTLVWNDDCTGLSAWNGLTANGNGAKAAKAQKNEVTELGGGALATNKVNAVRYGGVGVTNGVPAYLMGDAGSGIDMTFPRSTELRSVFWAMDVSPSDAAFFLGDSQVFDFHRGSKGQYSYGGTIALENSDVYCDGVHLNNNPCYSYPPTGFHVYSAVSAKVGAADSLSQDRGGLLGFDNFTTRTGGRALTELILLERALTDAERQEVENYLAVKWMADPAVTLSGETECALGAVYESSVTLDGAAVLSFATFPASGAPALTVRGKLCRGTAEKVRLAFPANTAMDHPATLLACATSIGVDSADDFEITGLPDDVVLYWNGRTLNVSRGAALLEPTAILRTAHLWLDAAADETFLRNASGEVTNWLDRSDHAYRATARCARYLDGNGAAKTASTPILGTVGVTNGVTAYLMGPASSGVDMSFPRTTELMTAFWAMDIESSPNAFFLGDGSTYHFHRTQSAPYSYDNRGDSGFSKGQIWCDGAKTSPGTDVPIGLHVYSSLHSTACNAERLSGDRAVGEPRSGGRALSELVLFNEALDPRARRIVESYLRAKWMNARETLAAPVNAPSADAVFPALDLADGAAFTLTNALDAADAAISVAGVLTKSASSRIAIDQNGQGYHGGDKVLECASSDGVTLDDFDLSSFGRRAVFTWNGQVLRVFHKPGMTVIVR